ncbi:UV radiation resistance-associated gene protein [Copidosoma floridanum]|uniref:UV radiation resistance-associated gene protein n=1 Tax=Copidosoma floridanum TaxID=29053 RepID=UPI0006C957F3|nr:UV radiation resistance-associated gene protein [Copidosoma floridanum]XP_014213896.1 UV radiation resistance-associated gene protein [Copidosoma floridanum]
MQRQQTEQTETHCSVRELDLTLQPRVVPRYKTWLVLATQQLRLRSLIEIIGYKLRTNEIKEKCWFYYTLHRTSMSSPLYTSEPIDNISPKWASLEVPTLYNTGHSNASEIIIRLWKKKNNENPQSDLTIFTWGISFTGLAYIGPKLPANLEKILLSCSLIFHLHGGYFVPPFCLITSPDVKKFLVMGISASEVRNSYTVSKLSSLRNKMQALKQQTDSVQSLKEKIASGESLNVPKYPQSTLNRLLQPKRISREKKAEILRIRKDLEVAKFRTKLLEHERVKKMGELKSLNQSHSQLMEQNQERGFKLMDKYRELNKDMEKLNEWRQNHADKGDTYIQTTARLAHRRKQLISELNCIYPIKLEAEDKFTINNVHLPDSERLDLANDTQVAVALGFVAHTTQMIANFLNVPTRYPIIHYGSRSKIIDHINENLPDADRQFPLFARSKDKLQFHYAVYLLNKNIAQLRWYCGLLTSDLRATLSNLSGLINVKPCNTLDSSRRTFSGSSLDMDLGSGKSSFPPTNKSLFDKYHRTTKTMLGSSLDQGLNQSMIRSKFLNNQSKRICKSEESALNICSISSGETFNDSAIFDKSMNEMSQGQANGNSEIDIEIMVPMSVLNPKFRSDSIENSACPRQRSSNSVSSCEMALSCSLADGEESSNGNSAKTEDNGDQVSASRENDSNSFPNTLKSGNESLAKKFNVNSTSIQGPLLKKVAKSSHSLYNKNDCDGEHIYLKSSSEQTLILKEYEVTCDPEKSLTAESFQAR